jgi:MATE family multidrug resistance protein
LSLAWPVVTAELGWMAMGVVDTIVVGRLGAEAIGAVSLGSALYFAVSIFGMGLLLGLDTLISQAFGAGKLGECRAWLVQGVYLGVLQTPVVMGLLWWGVPSLGGLGVHPSVLEAAIPFLKALTWGTLPLFVYSAFRRYLQAIGLVKPVMFALISANAINALADWALVYGRLGAPALGVVGAGWSTSISRLYMALVLVGTAVWHSQSQKAGLAGDCKTTEDEPEPEIEPGRISLAPNLSRLKTLLGFGWPAAVHVSLEVGVFAASTTLAGMLDPVSLAAHHVVLDIASVTFMIPLGLSSAGAVRVGQAIGRREPGEAGLAGWTALSLGAAFMTVAAIVFATMPRGLVSIFTTDPAVIGTGASLMLIAAAFQLFDGLQGVSTGAMRGAGDTHTPMVCNLVAYWVVGLPLGYLLTFHARLGIVGLWLGLATGLAISGPFLLWGWSRQARKLARGEFTLATDPAPQS